jgi:TfoX/Sxy family transcriptional regulator of competence genes
MSFDERTAERVRRLLSTRGDVVEKRMFGGLCFMVSGSMCCGLTKTALMVRVGRDAYDEVLARPHARPMDFTGRPLIGMVFVEPKGYETDEALAEWVQRAVDFTSTLPARRSKAPRKKSGPK